MANILYFGKEELEQRASGLLKQLGHRLIAAGSYAAIADQEQCAAIVLDWYSDEDSVILGAAQRAAVPSVVISRSIVAAFQAGEPFADLYLEEPVDPLELATALLELLGTPRSERERKRGISVAAA